MTSNSDIKIETKPAWQYVSVGAYNPPSAPVTYSARKRYASLRRLFQRGKPDLDVPLITTDKLLSLPHCQLDRLAPVPDWRSSADALGSELSDWQHQEKPTPSVIVLVGPPHSGNIGTLKAWQRCSHGGH